jgi:hypothetical protein
MLLCSFFLVSEKCFVFSGTLSIALDNILALVGNVGFDLLSEVL